MVDINSHAIIDMLESRDRDDVVEWLKSYPNLLVVSRDGSITYHNSIAEAHPEAIQVSGRFHLYKNLTDYAIEYLKKNLKNVIEVLADRVDITNAEALGISKSNKNRKLTLSEKYQMILTLKAENKSQTDICREVNMDVRSYKKLISSSTKERLEMFTTIWETKHVNKVANKMKIVEEVHALKCKGFSNRQISREMGLSRTTVSRYLDQNFNPVHSAYGVQKHGKLSAFKHEIDYLLDKGIMASKIEEIIRDYGYVGSSSTMRHYVSEWKKRIKFAENKAELGKNIITIKRNDIFKTLFKPTVAIKKLDLNIFQLFCQQYPFFKTILETVNSFKEIFQQNKPEMLKQWIDKARSTKIKELISFTNGIERDYDAVMNAARLPYSNGLAEGSVNKIKVIKRIMYGRCGFETLRSKTIQLEKMRKFN